MAQSAVNTKQVERREVAIRSIDEWWAELDRLETAEREGRLVTRGNWTAGQVFEHLGIFLRCSLDGFPGKPAPWPMRAVAQALFKKKAISGGSPPAGFKIPDAAGYLRPADERGFDEGLALLRAPLARVRGGARMEHPSPLFGTMTHEQWTAMQLGHARLHLGFLDVGPNGS